MTRTLWMFVKRIWKKLEDQERTRKSRARFGEEGVTVYRRIYDDSTSSGLKEVKFNITNALGEPITDREERLRQIRDRGLTADPDPGHRWSIPDDVITEAES